MDAEIAGMEVEMGIGWVAVVARRMRAGTNESFTGVVSQVPVYSIAARVAEQM